MGGNINADNTNKESRSASGNENHLPIPKAAALEKAETDKIEVKAVEKAERDKIEAKAVAWREAKMAKIDNRFKWEQTIIEVWENEQKEKANMKLKIAERKFHEKRAKASEKMQNEIAKAHRKAENRRAAAEARRSSATAKVEEDTEKIRSLGKLPRRKFLIF
eukprot:PITA_34696